MSDQADWDAGTWEGARRAALERSLRLTVRERLEVMEALACTARELARIGAEARGEDDPPPTSAGTAPRE